MKKLLYKTGGGFVVVLMTMVFALQPVKAQDFDYDGWQIYDAYTRINSMMNFESWIFTMEAIREEFGFSYLIGYMDGVNNRVFYSNMYEDRIKSEKWYQKGLIDGYRDRFLYQRNQCMSLQLLMAEYFGFFDYITPYRAVRNWLAAISHQHFFALNRCSRVMFVYLQNKHQRNRNLVYVNDPSERPIRPTDDYRNNGEHKNIPPGQIAQIPPYDPTDKPIRTKDDYRNKAEHKDISPVRISEVPVYDPTDKPTRSNTNYRNKGQHAAIALGPLSGRTNKRVLHRLYNNWPALRNFVEERGFDNIRVIDSIDKDLDSFNRTIIEIAIPGRQFDLDRYSSAYVNSLNTKLPEFSREQVREYRNRRSRDYNRNRYRRRDNSGATREVNTRTTNTEVRTSTRSRNRNRSNDNSQGRGTRGNNENS